MRRLVVGCAVCAAGIALALNADPDADADSGADLLDGSNQAIMLGPTGIPDTDLFPGYDSTIDSLYLEPLGFSSTGTITDLVTPETPFFGPSITAGTNDLVNAVEADYQAGTISPTDPLVIVGYSQSTVIESRAEPILAADGIPSDDLRFVMLGDAASDPSGGPTGILDSTLGQDVDDLLGWQYLNGTVTPDNLYPTDVFDVTNGFWEDTPGAEQTGILGLIEGNFLHGEYTGIPESVIQTSLGDPDVTGLTDYFTIPDAPDTVGSLVDTVLNNLFPSLADSGLAAILSGF